MAGIKGNHKLRIGGFNINIGFKACIVETFVGNPAEPHGRLVQYKRNLGKFVQNCTTGGLYFYSWRILAELVLEQDIGTDNIALFFQ